MLPNPASDRVTIVLGAPAVEGTVLELLDVDGRLVLSACCVQGMSATPVRPGAGFRAPTCGLRQGRLGTAPFPDHRAMGCEGGRCAGGVLHLRGIYLRPADGQDPDPVRCGDRRVHGALRARRRTDYGTAWRILRVPSLTDQIFIKAQRIRTLQTVGESKVGEGIRPELVGIINYAAMALVQLELGVVDQPDLDATEAAERVQGKRASRPAT